jgi:uncharacterized membrane protein YbhN (UPF0104 family)
VSADGAWSLALWQHAAALALVIMNIVARAGCSATLLRVPLSRCVIVNCCGDAVAALTPVKMGGEAMRYLGYTRAGAQGALFGASVATESMLDALILTSGAFVFFACFAETGIRVAKQSLDYAHAVSWRWMLLVPLVVAMLALLFTRTWFRGVRERIKAFLADSWHIFRAQSGGTIARAGIFALAAMLARTAILPVLLSRVPGIGGKALLLGSIAVLYLQSLAPTQGGLGVVEAGLIAALGGTVAMRDLVPLLVSWRLYAWLLGAGIGAVVLLRERLLRE